MASSLYPDGKARPSGTNGVLARVILPQRPGPNEVIFHVDPNEVDAVVSHRIRGKGEEYFIRWKVERTFIAPHSWHTVADLSKCLAHVQKYLDSIRERRPSNPLKRKTPDDESPSRPNPLATTYASTSGTVFEKRCYCGQLKSDAVSGVITVEPIRRRAYGVPVGERIPWEAMDDRAAQTFVRLGPYEIEKEFLKGLELFNRSYSRHARVQLSNTQDAATPSLRFTFTDKYVLGDGVTALDPGTVTGCGDKKPWGHQRCRPNMGQNVGCEYARVCDCMEYAAVDYSRLNAEDKCRLKHDRDNKVNLPKRYPYSQQGQLVSFYLNSRHCIYECNSKCECGPECKSRVVQKGRQVPLEIFRTGDGRGWGLKTLAELKAGSFVDTYRGEIITSEEGDRREEAAKQADNGKMKDSYLFSLDKHAGEELDLEQCYLVDGEHIGGPTRFINHSCMPNCQMHTVSMNRHDIRIYELAFFTNQDVDAGTELTFDYTDNDGDEIDAENLPRQGEGQRCRCGAPNCRGWLWL